MSKHRTVIETPRLDAKWERHPSVSTNGLTISAGDSLKVKDQPGRYIMHEYVDTGKHQWVAVYQDGTARSFRLTDILKPSKVRK